MVCTEDVSSVKVSHQWSVQKMYQVLKCHTNGLYRRWLAVCTEDG